MGVPDPLIGGGETVKKKKKKVKKDPTTMHKMPATEKSKCESQSSGLVQGVATVLMETSYKVYCLIFLVTSSLIFFSC